MEDVIRSHKSHIHALRAAIVPVQQQSRRNRRNVRTRRMAHRGLVASTEHTAQVVQSAVVTSPQPSAKLNFHHADPTYDTKVRFLRSGSSYTHTA